MISNEWQEISLRSHSERNIAVGEANGNVESKDPHLANFLGARATPSLSCAQMSTTSEREGSLHFAACE